MTVFHRADLIAVNIANLFLGHSRGNDKAWRDLILPSLNSDGCKAQTFRRDDVSLASLYESLQEHLNIILVPSVFQMRLVVDSAQKPSHPLDHTMISTHQVTLQSSLNM